MVKAIDKIKEWAKENVQLITILPENENLQVKTRLKDVLETSVDEKYYLSDEKTALLVAKLEEKDKVVGTVGHHPFSKKFEFSGYNSEVSPTLLATDYKAPKTVLEEYPVIKNHGVIKRRNDDISTAIDAHYANGIDNHGQRTWVAEKKSILIAQLDEIMKTARPNQEIQYTFKENGDIRPHRMDAKKSGVSELNINYEENPSHTVTTTHAPKVYGETTRWRIRKLTPLECFRLQSFPDWTYHEATEVNSNSQLYKQAGNSVTVNVIYEIAKRLN